MNLEFVWVSGDDEVFRNFYLRTEAYYNSVVGGEKNRKDFIPYNLSSAVEDVLLVYDGQNPAACAGLKRYSETDAEIKRVWVEPAYRRNHIASMMMARIEQRAREKGYRRAILQTREIMKDAVALYTKLGYRPIGNYPPYDQLEGAVCLARNL